MASTQRSVFQLEGSVSSGSAAVASSARLVPVGASLGGVELRISLGTGGAFAGGTVGAKLQGTNEHSAADPTIVSDTATWHDIPAGTLAGAGAAQSAFVGDGNNNIDLTAFLFLRVLPTVSGAPVSIDVVAWCKFDYQRG
jgi:hypothetical protein